MVAINLVEPHFLSGFLIDCTNIIKECYKQMGLLASGSIWAIGVDTNQIYQAVTWKSSNMFAWHYRLDVLQKQLIRFSMRILQATATSSAEFPSAVC